MKKVYMMVDFMGDAEVEYKEITDFFGKAFPKESCDFHRGKLPHDLSNDLCDFYVFDFGGLMPGCTDMVSSQFNELVRQVADHPNTVFIMWSSFTRLSYEEAMQEIFEHEEPQHNVVYRGEDDEVLIKKIKAML